MKKTLQKSEFNRFVWSQTGFRQITKHSPLAALALLVSCATLPGVQTGPRSPVGPAATQANAPLQHLSQTPNQTPNQTRLPRADLIESASGQVSSQGHQDVLALQVLIRRPGFKVQALELSRIKTLRAWVKGTGIAEQIWNQGTYVSISTENPENGTSLQIQQVPRGKNRVVSVQGYDQQGEANQAVPGALLKDVYDSPASSNQVTLYFTWRSTATATVIEALLAQAASNSEVAELLDKLDRAALNTFLDAIIYGTNPSDGNQYVNHPSRIDSDAIATYLIEHGGVPPAHTPGQPVPEQWLASMADASLTVKAPHGQQFVDSDIQVQITDPASSVVTLSGGASQANLPDIIPGNWEAIFKIEGPLGSVETRVPVVVDANGQITLPDGGSVDVPALLPPIIKGLENTVGTGGTQLIIQGDGFNPTTGGNTVKFGDLEAEVLMATATSLVVNIPGGLNGNSAITVTNNGKTSNAATYAVPIAVTAMSSTAGNAGDNVTLTVSGYAPDAVPTTVTFPDGAGGSVTATVTGSTASTITVTIPDGAVTGPITLQPEGLATLQTPNYMVHPIAVTAISNTAGNIGDSLTITVSGYAPNAVPTTVSFPDGAGGSVTATVTGSTASTITVTVPAGAVTGPITLQPEGLATLQTPTYTIGELAITNVTAAPGSSHPADGPYLVTQKITVSGVKLDEATTVTVGGQLAAFVKNPDGTLTVTLPTNPASGTLVVTTPNGNVSTQITILAPPVILSAVPSGPDQDFTELTLSGGHFTHVTQVSVAGVVLNAGDYTIQDDGTLVLHNLDGNPVQGNITVTNPAGTALTSLTYKNVVNFVGNAVSAPNTIQNFAGFCAAHGINVDKAGNIYVADFGCSFNPNIFNYGHSIHKFSPAGQHLWSTGSNQLNMNWGSPGRPGSHGFQNGPVADARFDSPEDVANDLNNNIYVADTNNHAIRKITPEGQVTTLARVPGPEGLQVSPDGKLYVTANYPPNPTSIGAMQFSYVLRIDDLDTVPADLSFNVANPTQMSSNVTIIAGGTPDCSKPTVPVTPLSDSRLCHVEGIGMDGDGNVYVADVDNYQLRKLSVGADGKLEPHQGTSTIFASFEGAAPSTTTEPRIYMHEIRVDRVGNVFIPSPTFGPASGVYRVSPTGQISLIAGNVLSGLQDGKPLTQARFSSPRGVDFGLDGSLYVADTSWGIRKIERYHPVANLQVP